MHCRDPFSDEEWRCNQCCHLAIMKVMRWWRNHEGVSSIFKRYEAVFARSLWGSSPYLVLFLIILTASSSFAGRRTLSGQSSDEWASGRPLLRPESGRRSQFRSVTVRGEHGHRIAFRGLVQSADQQCQSRASGEKLRLRPFSVPTFGAGGFFDSLHVGWSRAPRN